MKLSDRLSRMEALLEMQMKATEKLVDALDGKDGLVVRLDRVEESSKCLRRWTGVVGATALAALVQRGLPKFLGLFH